MEYQMGLDVITSIFKSGRQNQEETVSESDEDTHLAVPVEDRSRWLLEAGKGKKITLPWILRKKQKPC